MRGAPAPRLGGPRRVGAGVRGVGLQRSVTCREEEGLRVYRVGTRVETVDRGARVHNRRPDKREGVGVVRDHYRPHGKYSRDKSPPYYVVFDDGESAWYDEDEVERVKK